MSALARYFLSQKSSVSGSDSTESLITRSLKKDGAEVKIGHNKANIPPGTGLVVITQAVRPDNPELKDARTRGIRVLTYPEAVGELTEQYKTIAIAGAHGKSTTTALAALALIAGGLDPTVIIGTNLKEFGGKNFRQGKGKYLVLEADEFGRAFLHYSPCIAIATNIDREHLDVYKNLAGAKNAFLTFFENVMPEGLLIVNRDDKNLFSLRTKIAFIAQKKHLKVIWYSLRGWSAKGAGAATQKTVGEIKNVMQIPGVHNVSNALAAYALGAYLKISEKELLSALGAYHGSWRRYEYKGTMKMAIAVGEKKRITGIKVFDDYAHHPTELKATLRAYNEKFSGSKIVCVFQPHQAERLRLLFEDFISSFKDADLLVLIPSYRVAGRDAESKKFTSEKLADAIKKKYPAKEVYFLKSPATLKKFLTTTLGRTAATRRGTHARTSPQAPPILIMMGAGDIVNYTDSLLH